MKALSELKRDETPEAVPCETCDETGELSFQAGGYEQPDVRTITCPCCRGRGQHTAGELERLGGSCLGDDEAYREYEEQTWRRVLRS